MLDHFKLEATKSLRKKCVDYWENDQLKRKCQCRQNVKAK